MGVSGFIPRIQKSMEKSQHFSGAQRRALWQALGVEGSAATLGRNPVEPGGTLYGWLVPKL